MEYILLKNQLQDKSIYEKLIHALDKRIQHLIDEELGLRGMSFDEIKVQKTEFKDRYSTAFAKVEDLDRDRKIAKEQLDIIQQFLDEVDQSIKSMNDKEKEIFRLKYIHGLSNKEIENRGIACDKTIRTYLKEIDRR